ncbi:MAG: hypothetical protein VB095_03095 [Anaerovorax sp.]|nr:hypothetical protein [Anaerovorax sp.]
MMNDGIYLFLQNVQIATMIVSFVCFLLSVVALIFFIAMMFYGIKVAKIYIREHEADKKPDPIVSEAILENEDGKENVQNDEDELLEEKEE